MPYDSPLHVVHSYGSAEGSVQQHDWMVLVTKLNDRIDGLEKDLLQTKKTYSTALTKSANDKGKAKMEEPATPKKVKKRTQVQLSMDEDLARKMEEEEERIRFNAEQEARALQEEEEERLNLEAARELQRQLDQRQEVPTQPTQSQGIDWNDPSVLRYHAFVGILKLLQVNTAGSRLILLVKT
ncbi:hypothetical protein Tco_0888686 [Tanacetum coccineum]